VELGKVAIEIKSGFACGNSDKNTEGVPHIRPMNIRSDGQFVWEGTKYISEEEFEDKTGYKVKKGDVLFNNTNSKELVGKTCFVKEDISGGYSNHITRIRGDNARLDQKYLSVVLHYLWGKGVFFEKCNKWVGQAGINNKALSAIQIPLPPLEVQEKIVAELDGYQKIIDGAKQVVKNYKPTIKIDPEWPLVEVGRVCDIKSGGTPRKDVDEYWENGEIPWLGSGVCKDSIVSKSTEFITKTGFDNSSAKKLNAKTTLIALVGATIGKTAFLTFEATTNQNIAGLYPLNFDELLPEFLFYISQNLYPKFISLGSGKFRMANLSFIRGLKIPLPPLETQQKIVAEIELERELVEANKKLIGIYEKKIKDKTSEVWGE